MKQINKIVRALKAAQEALGVFDSKLNRVLVEILPFLDFEHPEDSFFHVEDSTDGIVLADSFAKIYSTPKLLEHIELYGAVKSYQDLQRFSI